MLVRDQLPRKAFVKRTAPVIGGIHDLFKVRRCEDPESLPEVLLSSLRKLIHRNRTSLGRTDMRAFCAYLKGNAVFTHRSRKTQPAFYYIS